MLRTYAGLIVQYRTSVLILSLLITVLLGLQLRNLNVIVDADELLPRDHPFVQVTERVQAVFGNRYTVVIGITPSTGDVYTPATLGKVLAVTNALVATPGVTPGTIQSLAAPRAKDIAGTADGLVVSRLLDRVPASVAEARAVGQRLAANPAYRDMLVSSDGRTAAVYVEFKKDPKGFGAVMAKVEAAVAPIRAANTRVEVAGQPVFLGLLESFSKRMTVHTGTALKRVERTPDGKRVVFEKDGRVEAAEAAEVLLALGRRAAVDGLQLSAAGVEMAKGNVRVSATMQTSAPHIFAAGDVCGEADVVHVAIQQGELSARNAARMLRGESGLEEMDYRLKLFGVFTEPQVAAVGMNETEAAASGRTWKAATYPFNGHGKSMVMGQLEGFVKMIADTGTGEILGASVVGPEAVELIHEVCVAMHFRCTVAEFARIPFYHPTLSEIWTYPAEELM